jgi:hypothetical protein
MRRINPGWYRLGGAGSGDPFMDDHLLGRFGRPTVRLRSSEHPERSKLRALRDRSVDELCVDDVSAAALVELVGFEEDAFARTVEGGDDGLISESVRNCDDARSAAGVVALATGGVAHVRDSVLEEDLKPRTNSRVAWRFDRRMTSGRGSRATARRWPDLVGRGICTHMGHDIRAIRWRHLRSSPKLSPHSFVVYSTIGTVSACEVSIARSRPSVVLNTTSRSNPESARNWT